jgi:hypothetical protein
MVALPDGTIMLTFPDVTITVTSADGTIMVTPSKVTITVTSDGGTVMVTSNGCTIIVYSVLVAYSTVSPRGYDKRYGAVYTGAAVAVTTVV